MESDDDDIIALTQGSRMQVSDGEAAESAAPADTDAPATSSTPARLPRDVFLARVKANRICHVCGASDHRAGFDLATGLYNDCRNKACYLCKQMGHGTAACPYRVSASRLAQSSGAGSKEPLLSLLQARASGLDVHSEVYGSAVAAGTRFETRLASSLAYKPPPGAPLALPRYIGTPLAAGQATYRVATGVLRLHRRRVTAMRWHPYRPSVLVSGDKAGDIALWDTADKEAERVLWSPHKWVIAAMDWAPPNLQTGSSSAIFTASGDGTLKLIDAESRHTQTLLNLNPTGLPVSEKWWRAFCSVTSGECAILASVAAATGRYGAPRPPPCLVPAFAGDDRGRVWGVDPRLPGGTMGCFQAHRRGQKVASVDINPFAADTLLATAGNDWTVKLWDVRRLSWHMPDLSADGGPPMAGSADEEDDGEGGSDAAPPPAKRGRGRSRGGSAAATCRGGSERSAGVLAGPLDAHFTRLAAFTVTQGASGTGRLSPPRAAGAGTGTFDDPLCLSSSQSLVSSLHASPQRVAGVKRPRRGGYGEEDEERSEDNEDGGRDAFDEGEQLTSDLSAAVLGTGGLAAAAAAAASSSSSSSSAGGLHAEPEPLAVLRHPRVVTSVCWSLRTGSKLLTTCIDNRLRVWNCVAGGALSDTPDVVLVHSQEFNRHLTPFRAVWDPKDPRENTVVCGRYISEPYNGVPLHPVDVLDVSKARLKAGDPNPGGIVRELVDPLVNTICTVNAVHPFLPLVGSGTSKNVFLWAPGGAAALQGGAAGTAGAAAASVATVDDGDASEWENPDDFNSSSGSSDDEDGGGNDDSGRGRGGYPTASRGRPRPAASSSSGGSAAAAASSSNNSSVNIMSSNWADSSAFKALLLQGFRGGGDGGSDSEGEGAPAKGKRGGRGGGRGGSVAATAGTKRPRGGKAKAAASSDGGIEVVVDPLMQGGGAGSSSSSTSGGSSSSSAAVLMPPQKAAKKTTRGGKAAAAATAPSTRGGKAVTATATRSLLPRASGTAAASSTFSFRVFAGVEDAAAPAPVTAATTTTAPAPAAAALPPPSLYPSPARQLDLTRFRHGAAAAAPPSTGRAGSIVDLVDSQASITMPSRIVEEAAPAPPAPAPAAAPEPAPAPSAPPSVSRYFGAPSPKRLPPS